jgi:predicted RNase H-related nuclease YkuK (DUF458 family)
MRNLQFKKFDDTIIKDVHEYVKYWVKENPYGTVTIGCDSQEHTRYIKYAVNIVMHYKDESGIGHGGHIIYSAFNDNTKNIKSDVYTKLWAETEVTIEIAKLVGDIGLPIKIHLDYNSDPTKYSNVLYAAGIGFCKGMGYEAEGKPYAWAASHIADRIAKGGKKR